MLYNMCNIGAVMHWCFDCTNEAHSNYFIYTPVPPIGHMDWIGFIKLDPSPTHLISPSEATCEPAVPVACYAY